ncbi:MAG: prolipoprotein diacylglyceryl transferase, partial [Clostridiales bacterium]|nr:prolipoprotein diacylglyceryl transferase [Clostridiales bacterium]
KRYRKYDGQLFLLYLAWYGFGRFWIEGLRTDSLYLFDTNLRISQLVAALSMGAAVYFLVRFKLRKSGSSNSLYVNKTAQIELAEIDQTTNNDKE